MGVRPRRPVLFDIDQVPRGKRECVEVIEPRPKPSTPG